MRPQRMAGQRTSSFTDGKPPCFYIPDENAHIVKIYRVIYGKRDMERQLKDKTMFEE
ncbi:MAG: hypothetical protein Q4D77_02555 [Peptostreptococcaceae bacterium]|nr:hypothetical protein [Peptostreptococcaceae bacterium]